MYKKSMLGLEQCQAAINAMITEFKKDPSNDPISMAIVDDLGNLLAYARTDGSRPLGARNCIKKAYTSAISGFDSAAYVERLKSLGITVGEMGDPVLLSAPGAVVVRNPGDGAILGGIGVSGLPSGQADEDTARAGLKAMKL